MDATDVQQTVRSLDARGGMPNLFHALGAALLISMGYIDLGKWVAAVEAGSRFGFDLVLLVLLFNFTAIVFQYLAACIGTVTGKNLAEVNHLFPFIKQILYWGYRIIFFKMMANEI
jgi:ethylene-insensitive protein 2